jgi:PH (Pleckstrin Homology) domain-containing protein
MASRRPVLVAALLAALLACAFLSMGAPRLTLQNADVHIAYPWPRPAAALLSALAAVAVALVVRTNWARVLAVAFALAAALAAAHLVLYRVRAGSEGIEARTLLGSDRLAWRAITQVETGPGLLLIRGGGGERVRVDTTDFRAEDRAALDRTIARRLNAP